MTLFRKVFATEGSSGAKRPIRTSYDLAMAPEPDELVEMSALSEMLTGTPPVTEATQAERPVPNDEAVAEAQALLNSAQSPTRASLAPNASGTNNKTRILGFNSVPDEALDPIKAQSEVSDKSCTLFPAGWLVITDGPGRGSAFPLFSGVLSIGRSASQAIALDFGDTSISRENHAAVAFDEEQRSFFIGHGGKSNIIRLNGQPVLSTETMQHGDLLRIGETTLRLVALCGDDFKWGDAVA